VLDRLLVDAAAEARADIVYGVRLHTLMRSASGRVNGVVFEDASGRVQRIASTVVVGADGLRSTVAGLAEAWTYRAGTHATATLYGHWDGLDVDGYDWYFVPGLAAGAIPTNSNQACVFVAMPGRHFTRLPQRQLPGAFGELLAKVAPALAAQVARAGHAKLHGFPGHTGFFRRSYGPGWALVGDAGYFKDPLTAHGITDALRDAELLATAIEAGSDAALAAYEEQRDEASLELFETTDAIASFNWNLEEVRLLHEALARAMSREAKQLIRA
jgi:flavin-dependent dehydrogenase